MTANDAEPQTKTVVISWVEESHHQATLRVPTDFDAAERDLVRGLAALSDDGFEFLERAVVEVRTIEPDPTAEFFDPPRYDEPAGEESGGGIPARVCGGCEAVMIEGDVWRAFLAQETALDDEHPGQVSLSAVVGELLRMTSEPSQASGADG